MPLQKVVFTAFCLSRVLVLTCRHVKLAVIN